MGDRVELTKEIKKDGTESVTYRKEWESNGINHSKQVRKLEGGYIVTESKYGKPSDGGEDADYVDERKEYISTTNPFEKKKEEKEDNMFDFVDTPTF